MKKGNRIIVQERFFKSIQNAVFKTTDSIPHLTAAKNPPQTQ